LPKRDHAAALWSFFTLLVEVTMREDAIVPEHRAGGGAFRPSISSWSLFNAIGINLAAAHAYIGQRLERKPVGEQWAAARAFVCVELR
jgi:hypothetical protein